MRNPFLWNITWGSCFRDRLFLFLLRFRELSIQPKMELYNGSLEKLPKGFFEFRFPARKEEAVERHSSRVTVDFKEHENTSMYYMYSLHIDVQLPK